MNSEPQNKPFDRERFLAAENGDMEFAKELIGAFLEIGPGYLADIKQAVADKDATAIQKRAHKLKGAVGTFYAEPARLAAYELETAGRNNDLAGSEQLLADLEGEISRLLAAFEQFMAE